MTTPTIEDLVAGDPAVARVARFTDGTVDVLFTEECRGHESHAKIVAALLSGHGYRAETIKVLGGEARPDIYEVRITTEPEPAEQAGTRLDEDRLAAVLAGHEPGRLNRDRYDYWRRHCAGCAWSGSPWETRDQAIAEHRRHVAAELAATLQEAQRR